MPVFIYKRQRLYPELDIEVGLNLNAYPQLDHTAHAWLRAKGAPGDRARWRDDFWAWARDRELDAYSPRYGNRRTDNASAFDCYLRSWQVVADFLVRWVGTDALSTALMEADEDRQLTDKIAELTRTIQSLTHEVADLRGMAVIQQAAFRNVGLAMVAVAGTITLPAPST